MNKNLRKIAGLALVCAAFWSVLISVTTHSLGWFAFAAACDALAMVTWSE